MENTKELYDIINNINKPPKKKKLPLNKIFDMKKKPKKKTKKKYVKRKNKK